MKPEDAKLQYNAILDDLQSERSAHRRALIDCDQAISSLLRVMQAKGIVSSLPVTASAETAPIVPKVSVMRPHHHRFGMMSVRWAILLVLDESPKPLSTTELVEVLEAGGIRAKSKAANFSNNVSAVLSNMKSPRAEIEVVDGNFEITEKGRSAIHHIKLTRGIA